uniref:Signal peptidase complex subunit 3 n=1 Tax=Chromera velia CCMP2878 TaxID=1169474 RepID=A0A0G4GV65_9ALVE|mmetsp:Transcript_33091/g.65659  ORF Transcript_33091/g.65659 Transcript_33091/m.65659 type:complete len:187 (-) Transcript_33091:122-682(-)|eukprot:Cvel_23523.t1-p1 / transcript=Cvel_23523.t1 / gene=Cvel_23523 / organism=Chromera_velia_CCMP2878 / gene_product=Signal peptidase complex subunit 3, putative / transcript_product=Signal peptidase complex subunit 3, putative / location=Cvel_scaffold2434:238-795(-) / protein_length=186 / sequence_SO=supercontig / SO=protein_coding / is_pseudo=false
MESYSSRANTIFSNFVVCLGFFGVLNHVTHYFFEAPVTGTIKLANIYDMTVNQYLQSDQMNISFDLEADLSGVYTWNTNLLFVYVTASYKTQGNVRNEVTIWDHIIQTKEEAASVKYTDEVNEYQLRDMHRQLRSREITLSLKFRLLPIIGRMREFTVAQTTFDSPDKHFKYKPGHPHREELPDDY